MSSEEEELEAEVELEKLRGQKGKKNNMSDISDVLIETARFPKCREREIATIMNATRRLDGVDFEANPDMIVTKSKVHTTKKRVLTQLSQEAAQPTSTLFFYN